MSAKTNTIPSSMKACMDRSLAEFVNQSLSGKPVSLFFCSEGMYDVVALACVTFFTHHGAIYIPLGYPSPGVIETDQVPHGISPWGAGAIKPTNASDLEHEVARKQDGISESFCTAVSGYGAMSAFATGFVDRRSPLIAAFDCRIGRFIFSSSGIGMDQFLRIKEMTSVRLGTSQANIRKRVLEDIKRDDRQVFSEDLKNLLYIADNDDEINALVTGLKKYYKDGAGYSNFHFGAPVMRLLAFFNKTDKAIEVFADKVTEAAFKDSASSLVLMNHLIERRRYEDAVKIFEIALKRGFVTASGKAIPSDVLMLLVEALFCLNTPDAFVKLEKVLKDAKQRDCNITLKTIGMACLFAIKQKRPDVALEVAGYGHNQSSPLFRNIKAMCFADLGRLDEALQTVRVITESAASPGVSMRYDRHVYPSVMNHIRQAVEKSDDPDAREKFESLVRIIYDGKLMNNNDMEQFLLSPINRTYANNPRDMRQNEFDRQAVGQPTGFNRMPGAQQANYGYNTGSQFMQQPPDYQGTFSSPSQYGQQSGGFNQYQAPSFRPPNQFATGPGSFARPMQQAPAGFAPQRPGFAGGFPNQPFGQTQPMNQSFQGGRPPLRSPLSHTSPTNIRGYSNPTSNRPGPDDEDL